jgi:hypothetical protein
VTYQYKVVPFIGQNRGRLSAHDVATQLESLISRHAAEGWEFYQLSDVNIEVRPGCIAGLFGASAQYIRFDQLIFRAAAESSTRSTSGPRRDRARPSPKSDDADTLAAPELSSALEEARSPSVVPASTAAIWRQKSDEQIRQAVNSLHEYTEEGRQAVLAEFERRSLGASAEPQRAGSVRQPQEPLTYCYHCGADVLPNANRCAACGNDL